MTRFKTSSGHKGACLRHSSPPPQYIQMAFDTARVSAKFPPGYSDFEIKSGDGGICYFPSQILSHLSTVFRDMFSFPEVEIPDNGSSKSVAVTEPLDTLELFLTHLDPRFRDALIDPETVETVLETANKYQAGIILEWFEREATIQRLDKATVTIREAFIVTHPIIALKLALRFELKQIIPSAMREVARRPLQTLEEGAKDLNLPIYLAICRLRQKHIERYQRWIKILTDYRRIHPCYYLARTYNEDVPVWHIFTESDGVHEVDLDDDEKKVCIECTIRRAGWTYKMLVTVQSTPTWTSFVKAFGSDTMCRKCGILWSYHFRDALETWEGKALKEEAELPEYPI